ncbi:MAG: hypothetical protein NT062_11800, partial [Proteobacteria bacterium]|nr:hypothetical protein [Pseudomonadota bacterium]
MRTAPFRVRPDSASAGSLLGPFNGRVVDATTHAAIAGALVYATWSFERGTGLTQPGGAREFVGSTDAGGNYRVPTLADTPSGTRVTEFTLLVYKRGYVAYRSDRRFADLGARMDFAQRENQVLLERWRSELSHARHLRFVGGGTAVAALTSWELADASAELDTGGVKGNDLRPGRGDGQYIVAAQLLSDTDITSRTKFDGGIETGPLSDEPDTAVVPRRAAWHGRVAHVRREPVLVGRGRRRARADDLRPDQDAPPECRWQVKLALVLATSFGVGLLGLPELAHAWESETTQAGLAEQAALSSNLHKRLVLLGFSGGLFEPLTVPPADAPQLIEALKLLSPTHGSVPDARGRQTALAWLAAGAALADIPAANGANHFFDPTTGLGWVKPDRDVLA